MQKIQQWTTNPLECLPLNTNFNMGGSTLFSSVERYFTFKFTCPAACGTTTNCGSVEFFTQNMQINQGNADNPFTHYLDRKSFIISNPTTYENVYEVDQKVLNSDNWLIFSRFTEGTGLSAGQFHTDVPTTNASTTTLHLKRSDKTVTYNRILLKLFDVFAYIGGLLQFLFILFFFMPSFGRMLF